MGIYRVGGRGFSVTTAKNEDTDKPQPPRSVYEAFDHDERCNVWIEDGRGHHLDHDRECTCGGYPVVACPQCGAERKDLDGFGVLHCDACGYCQHPSVNGTTCGLCGQELPS
jgi:hypothetical protein